MPLIPPLVADGSHGETPFAALPFAVRVTTPRRSGGRRHCAALPKQHVLPAGFLPQLPADLNYRWFPYLILTVRGWPCPTRVAAFAADLVRTRTLRSALL